jgi:RND superfamily putative drug exporter
LAEVRELFGLFVPVIRGFKQVGEKPAELEAVLHLMGRWTWALPASLERRLPHLAVDGELAQDPPEPPASAARVRRGRGVRRHRFV